MPPSPQRDLFGAGLATVLPLAAYAVIRLVPGADPHLHSPPLHVLIVGGTALLATITGTFIALAGARLRNLQVVLLSMSFVSLGVMQVAHGLSTPGFLLPETAVVPTSGQLSVLLAAFWLWLSCLPVDHPLVRPLAQAERLLPAAWTTALLSFAGVLFFWPGVTRFLPVYVTPVVYGVALLTLTFAGIAAVHYARSYRYARFPLQLTTVYAAGWMIVAQVILTTSSTWNGSWWIYHFLLFAGVAAGLFGLIRQYGHGGSLSSAVQGLWTRDADALLDAGISPSVRALVRTLEAHDPYTAGHSYRVAREAVRLGRAAGCTPEELRALAQGGILHDLGKLDVDGGVLNKPGRLDADERRAVEQHPRLGYERCRHLGFLPAELAVIRHHHERWDGTGYPDALAGEQIPRLARILAIADVYDALTSERAYRTPWTPAQAHVLLLQEAGRHFDPVLVLTWLRLQEGETEPRESTPVLRPALSS